jgi:hypothetical protein
MGGRWKAYRQYNSNAVLRRTARGKTYSRTVDDESAFLHDASGAMRGGRAWTTATSNGEVVKNVYVGSGNRLGSYNGINRRNR